MTITKKTWTKYIAALRRINEKATESMLYYIQEHGMPKTQDELSEFIYTAFNVSNKYGEAAAALACEMYDAVGAATSARIAAAEPAETATYNEVAKAVKGTLKTDNPNVVASAVGRLVKQTGVDTTVKNALRDGAEWAWIPQGDTCPFCIMLASRGWQRASKKAIKNGHAEHIHANCDCTYAIRFDSKSDVQGYAPKRYERMYYGADGNTPREKLNAMRRDYYAEHKDEINAQKREAYAERKEREA